MALIIAEVGVNHNGDETIAQQLIDVAVDANVDVVKFQTFRADELATKTASQASYQAKNIGKTESQYEMLRRLELSDGSHKRLKKYCDERAVEFLSTAFDVGSLRFLLDEIGLKRLKVPSGEITNYPLVLEHAKAGLDIIVSTGMASLGEIESVLGVLAFGFIADKSERPSISGFREAYFSQEGREALLEKVTLLHCTTEYPVAPKDVNLKAISSMRSTFGLPVGYSDHSMGITVPILAKSLGAAVIEKHFTLSRELEGPDHRASLEPEELVQMVSEIRLVEELMGDGVKMPRSVELANKSAARKSLVALTDIACGELFSSANLGVKRPGSGIEPKKYWEYVDKPAQLDYRAGDLIDE